MTMYLIHQREHPQFYHLLPNSGPDDLMWTINPAMTLDSIYSILYLCYFLWLCLVIKSIPKADLHCRLDSSVSIPLVWKEVKDAKVNLKELFGVKCESEEAFTQVLCPTSGHTPTSRAHARSIITSVLQTKEQLEHAVQDVLL